MDLPQILFVVGCADQCLTVLRDRVYLAMAVLDVVAVSKADLHKSVRGETNMPVYIALLKWTEQGVGNVKDSPARLDAGRKAFKKMGVKIKDTYLTMGRYDLVCVIDAPDDETFAAAMLTLGSQGNVQTETLKAFTEDQYRKICASVQ